ncbi:uracil-DNA glycosylase [Temperatibacter marinus]|uniref:Type-5 uracil-DNA glycosylase n=1 Tax=Temperatibacter marinus TaxID=1456591 RepID=A0AA52H8L7_9PROT|nr:uracil-DNA glycosylase [Temperatibacter marinus]WND01974.1 uracil-DNA glycosylase [Temperatibacter marinus]
MRCKRLVAFRRENKKAFPDYFNKATGSFGDLDARLAIIGLAPGLHGANRTGRPFTGDQSGTLLFKCLESEGLSNASFDNRIDDGFTLNHVIITNAVRCVPPQNKPTPEEISNCRPFLHARLRQLPKLRVLVALGRIAHETILKAYDYKLGDFRFEHGAIHNLPNQPFILIDSYHCSRYNVNTGRITEDMLKNILRVAKKTAGL